jgi:hypothetical protein
LAIESTMYFWVRNVFIKAALRELNYLACLRFWQVLPTVKITTG